MWHFILSLADIVSCVLHFYISEVSINHQIIQLAFKSLYEHKSQSCGLIVLDPMLSSLVLSSCLSLILGLHSFVFC